jgi:hypothetical protein
LFPSLCPEFAVLALALDDSMSNKAWFIFPEKQAAPFFLAFKGTGELIF